MTHFGSSKAFLIIGFIVNAVVAQDVTEDFGGFGGFGTTEEGDGFGGFGTTVIEGEPTNPPTDPPRTERPVERTTQPTFATSKPIPRTPRPAPQTRAPDRATPAPGGNFQTPAIGIRVGPETAEHLKYNDTISPCPGLSYQGKCYHGGQCIRDNGVNRCVCDQYFVGSTCNTKALPRPITGRSSDVNPTTMRGKWYVSKNNPTGVGNTIGRWYALSSLDCMNKCKKLKSCNSINYGENNGIGVCELLDISAGPNTFLREDNGWIKDRAGWSYTCCVNKLNYRGIGR